MVKAPQEGIPARLTQAVCERLVANQRVRRTLPLWGRLHVDRQLPFLTVYRRPVVGADEGMYKLVTSEASYLFAPGIHSYHRGLSKLVDAVAATLSRVFGGFLIVEVSAGVFDFGGSEAESMRPAFRVKLPKGQDMDELEETVERALSKVRVRKRTPTVELLRRARTGPPDLPRLLSAARAAELRVTMIGLEVKPIHLDPKTGNSYPLVLRELEHELTRALRQVFFQFARSNTTHRPRHYHGLGRRAFVKAVWEVDKRLAAVSSGFDFLLQVTPTNSMQAWRQFQKNKFKQAPVFRYRPLPVDPIQLKRQLYSIPIDRLEDPVLRELFREKQMDLGRRLTMLLDINTPKFLYGSLQVYGSATPKLVTLAEDLLQRLPRKSGKRREKPLSPTEIAQYAEEEFAFYRQITPEFRGSVQIRDDTAGLMVSRGALLISRQSRVTPSRLDALLQHEIGTHLVTYYNGRAQPFRQLASGLAGYEALQEGLAVLAEYLVAGLNADRLRLLAARVMTANQMINHATFAASYRLMTNEYGFDRRTAFTTTMRVYRGGGLTKDTVYLQGLIDLLQYLREGGRLEPLFIGKIAASHVPIIEELRWREVLRPAPLRPRFLDHPEAKSRLAAARNGLDLVDLTKGSRTR